MKTNYSFLMVTVLVFMLSLTTIAQTTNCETFDNGIGDWKTSYIIGGTNNITLPTIDPNWPKPSGAPFILEQDNINIQGNDNIGIFNEILFNQVLYTGNLRNNGDCLCFDFSTSFHVVQTFRPTKFRLTYYQGDMTSTPRTIIKSATYTFNTDLTNFGSLIWHRLCVPISAGVNGQLPTGPDGVWSMPSGQTMADFNAIMTNTNGIYFDVHSNSNSNYIAGERFYDNICFECVQEPEPTEDGAYCCDGENLVANGNFELGNSGFLSTYGYNSAVNPGEYDVTNNAGAFGATVTDHSFCADPILYPNNDMYMTVNGKTQQTNSAIIWAQTISGLEKGSNYKFCANFKNMPQCTFDILPNVNMGVSGIGNTGFATISANPADPCDWVNREFNFTATSTSVTLLIVLDQTGNGDGNDLAIDDISVTKSEDPDLTITVQHQGNPQQIIGSINSIDTTDDVLFGTDCEYYWFVGEVISYPPIVVSGPSFASGNAAGNSIGSSPWNLTTTFPDYTFNQNTLYVIGMYTPACECYEEGFTYQLTYNNFSISEDMTEEQEQLIIHWILNGYNGTSKTSSNQVKSMKDFLIYPNPVEDSFNISLLGDSLESIEVLNLTGQRILLQHFSEGKSEGTVNLSSLAAGVYMVKIHGLENKIYTAKVVKK